MDLLPIPRKIVKTEERYEIRYDAWIIAEPSCSELVKRQAGIFAKELEKELGYGLAFSRGKGRKGDIIIRQDDTCRPESYRLRVNEQGVLLEGEEKGLWHGMQTLLQMIRQEGGSLPGVEIQDEPALPNRGYYFDCARGRVPKLSWLKELADRMAYYKMNQLQLYIEHSFLFRDFSELWRDDTPLTAAEIMELDDYCKERGIELVPSLSSFGHLYKLLSSRQYCDLCELEDSEKQPFSYRARMHHHTINAADPRSAELLKRMIGEYMELFSSRQFNICADETFDLGQGRSRKAVEELGKSRVYINYVKELAQFLVDHGRRPMFWGDVILNFPEMIKELPKEMICLNWGYLWNQREEETRWMAEAGATQYCCPGVCGWNQFINLNWNAYENNKRLASYAVKYGAIGLLNTDWGDFAHMNHPDFSRAGMIYGASFSWNPQEIPAFEEMNRRVETLEFSGASGEFLNTVAKLPENSLFQWEGAVRYMELRKGIQEFEENHREYLDAHKDEMKLADEKNACIRSTAAELYRLSGSFPKGSRKLIKPYLVGAEAMRIFNDIGKVVYREYCGMEFADLPDCMELARELETWFYHYKQVYRSVSKESELWRMQEMICFYGDLLRDLGRNA